LLLSIIVVALPACVQSVDSERTDSTSEALTDRPAVVFTMTNAASGNAVLAFHRNSDGTGGGGESYATGGLGSGAGLGSQGALTLTGDGRFLLVVNPGSNDLSSFAVDGLKLKLLARVPSGGTLPVSVASHGDVVYVLNAGAPNNVTGLRIASDGSLSPIADSARALSAPQTAPAQVGFAPNGLSLVVTEKATNVIDSFRVGPDGGLLDPGMHNASSGVTPFGFDFSRSGRLIVSEAFGAAPGATAVSSYALRREAAQVALDTVSASVASGQTAACWLVATSDGRYAYAANTPNGTISGFRVDGDGALSLLDPSGVTANPGPGARPTDMALDAHSRSLFVLVGGSSAIREYEVAEDGSLSDGPVIGSVPRGTVGLAAR
jgi:6-phosphogluconolactonase (cycloisomerase 2 family)